MTTPSKESLSAAAMISAAITRGEPQSFATIIDTAFAEHRERVRRLVEKAEVASICLEASVKAYDRIGMWETAKSVRFAIDNLDAALAPFLEQETPT